MGSLSGISCQHPQVMATNVLQKHWERQDRALMLRHGSVVRPTMFLASMDIKTAFVEAEAEARGKDHGKRPSTL